MNEAAAIFYENSTESMWYRYEREEMNNKQERETMEEERMENLIEASRQVVEILQKNFHPHTTVVIEVDRIRVEETVEARVIEYAVD